MSSGLKLGSIHVMLADGRAHVRSTLKTALAHAGLENVDHAGTLDTVVGSIDQPLGPDILICDMGLKDGAACDFVQSIRQNDIGKNPFLCVLGVTWNPTEIAVVKMINAGIDLLIAAPVSPQQILNRIEALVYSRLPFIVTGSYVGPDRRKDRERGQTLALIDVPNTLRAKALGTWNADEMLRDIERATHEIKTRKIKRQADGIARIAAEIYELAPSPNATMTRPSMERLHALTAELERRVQNQNFSHLSELCEACVGVVRKMILTERSPVEKDLLLLKQVALAICRAMRPQEGESAIAHDIAKTVIAAR